jgi:DNA mismatch endonuclease, patch repair protein
MDNLTTAERSVLMSRVRSKDSKPELTVRSIVHRMGFRFRLHSRELPGCPDLVFAGRRKIIFVHGCFWHGHKCRAGRNRPASHGSYWNSKLDRNMKRDRMNSARLRRGGWNILTVWECQTREPASLAERLKRFLETR